MTAILAVRIEQLITADTRQYNGTSQGKLPQNYGRLAILLRKKYEALVNIKQCTYGTILQFLGTQTKRAA